MWVPERPTCGSRSCSLGHSLLRGLSCHHPVSMTHTQARSRHLSEGRVHTRCSTNANQYRGGCPLPYSQSLYEGPGKSASCDKLICFLFPMFAVQSHPSLPCPLERSELFVLNHKLPPIVFWYNYLPPRVLLSITTSFHDLGFAETSVGLEIKQT